MTTRRGVSAAAWFYGSSFHTEREPAPVQQPAVYVDTRPRVDYVLPDGRTVKVIHDQDQRREPTISYGLKGGAIVTAVRADLWTGARL